MLIPLHLTVVQLVQPLLIYYTGFIHETYYMIIHEIMATMQDLSLELNCHDAMRD